MYRITQSRRFIVVFAAVGTGLVVAFRLGPKMLLANSFPEFSDIDAIPRTLATELARYVELGQATFTPGLTRLVDYWFDWHAIKVGICLAMAAVFGALAYALSVRYVRDPSSSTRWAVAAGTVTALMLMACGLLAVNIQSTAAPVIALLPLVPGGAAPTGITGPATPALLRLTTDMARYDWVMASAAALFAVLFAAMTVSSLHRRSFVAGRKRTICTIIGTQTALAAGAFATLTVIAVLSATDPADSLRGVLRAG